MKFAAIDIGSNAVRLLLSRVFVDEYGPFFKKESLIRMPVRLGEDAFSRRSISPPKVEILLNTLIGFRHLMDAYQPLDYMACATSAMREVDNGAELVKRIHEVSQIDLQIIDGALEAEIIASNHFEERLNPTKSYLYIDVGGGSTELTVYHRRKPVASHSFKIGTVRLLQHRVPEERWAEMKAWIKESTAPLGETLAIGSGGNINRIFRLARKKESKPLSYRKIKDLYKEVRSYTYEDRIKVLGLKPDRAEVILPAFRIYLSAMKWGKIRRIYVPQIGLADGLIRMLYDRHRKQNNT